MPRSALLACTTWTAAAVVLAATGLPAHPAVAQPLERVQAQPQRHHDAINPALQSRIAQRMSHATAGHYGFVVDIANVGRVASLSPGMPMRPASTQKLFTILPLLLNRADESLTTDVVVANAPVDGVVTGDLVVRSSGDPSLVKNDLGYLARRVRHAGVTRVTGRLVLDIGSLPSNTRQQGWKWEFVPGDVGPLSPFPVDRDWWRTDKSYVAHPTLPNLDLLRKRLVHNGVRIMGKDAIVRSTAAAVELASHSSISMRGLITQTLRWSDNFYAESLLAVAGGHAPVNSTARAAGVTDASSATDGSGLSYDDRETARGEATLLDYVLSSPAATSLRHAMALACTRGTLRHRFCHTGGANMVYAKTGTLSHTAALAGYTKDALGRWVTFAVIAGGVRNTYSAEKAIDRAVLVLRNYSGSQG